MAIKAIIVDDEPLARDSVCMQLEAYSFVELAAECKNGREAIQAIRQYSPDLVFLDIKMPKMSGFDVIEAIGLHRSPVIIFLTAYDNFTLEAFKSRAAGYLLKPIDPEDFALTLDNAKVLIEQRALSQHAITESAPQVLAVKHSAAIQLLPFNEIDWIEAYGDYAKVHLADNCHLHNASLTALEQKLASAGFCRTHRSALVNSHKIVSIEPLLKGDYQIYLLSGKTVKLSRHYREALFQRINLI